MSYLVLARKYRPRTFEEVCGQEVPTMVLQGAIKEGRVGHAYLFSGPRGTGKTTSARIFAKALNCERGPTPTPCGECERCLASERGAEADIIEIDGASNRGIEDARALREEVGYAPMRARFKIYIIDEVHMLTTPAFNALLKTLEEPPPHVKFLFATTEPHKVIETIRSRCQMVALTLIDEATIAARLAEILTLEQVTPGEGVVEELARLARGSMRDALSVTDQLLALVGSQPTVEDVRRVSGPAGTEQIEELLGRVAAGDRLGLLESLPDTEGAERELVAGLLDTVREALISSLGSAGSEGATWAQGLDADRLQIWLEELLHVRERMQQLPEHARIVLEVTLLDLCRAETALPLALMVKRLGALEERLGVATPASPPGSTATSAPRAASPAPEASGASGESSASVAAPPAAPPPEAPARAEAPRAPAPRPAARAPRAVPQTAPKEPPTPRAEPREPATPPRPRTITPPAPQAAPKEPAKAVEAPRAPAAREAPVELKSKTPEPSGTGTGAGDGDAFIERVAELFDGKIEDNS